MIVLKGHIGRVTQTQLANQQGVKTTITIVVPENYRIAGAKASALMGKPVHVTLDEESQ